MTGDRSRDPRSQTVEGPTIVPEDRNGRETRGYMWGRSLPRITRDFSTVLFSSATRPPVCETSPFSEC